MLDYTIRLTFLLGLLSFFLLSKFTAVHSECGKKELVLPGSVHRPMCMCRLFGERKLTSTFMGQTDRQT